MTNEKIKPISADVHFQYTCPNCINTIWLSLAEARTEGYISVCDMCQKPSSPALVKNIKVIFDTDKPNDEKQEEPTETKMPKDIFDTCVDSLIQYGYTKTEARDLVASVDDPSLWHDPVQVIKKCLSRETV